MFCAKIADSCERFADGCRQVFLQRKLNGSWDTNRKREFPSWDMQSRVLLVNVLILFGFYKDGRI